jgi:hypothetical protein
VRARAVDEVHGAETEEAVQVDRDLELRGAHALRHRRAAECRHDEQPRSVGGDPHLRQIEAGG